MKTRTQALAAAIARDMWAGQASGAISTFSARSVVPLGLVTAFRRSAASCAEAGTAAPDSAAARTSAVSPGRAR